MISLLIKLQGEADKPNDELNYTVSNLYPKDLFKEVAEEIRPYLTKPVLKMFGKEIPIPRTQAGFGDKGVKYKFSGIEWTPTLLQIKNKVEEYTKLKFNFVLANYYKDEEDYISFHSDDEKELGNNPIVSISFGATRDFILQHNVTKEKIKVELKAGSILIMYHPTNQYYKHSIPKDKKVKDPRINLTFRTIVKK